MILSAKVVLRGGRFPAGAALFYGRTFYANCNGADNNYAHYPFHVVEDADRVRQKGTERGTERERETASEKQSRVITRHLLKQA